MSTKWSDVVFGWLSIISMTFAKGAWDRAQDSQGGTWLGAGVAGVPLGAWNMWQLPDYSEANHRITEWFGWKGP